MLTNPREAARIVVDCRNALVSARVKLRVAVTRAELDHLEPCRNPERLAIAKALLQCERAVAELSHALALCRAEQLRAKRELEKQGASS